MRLPNLQKARFCRQHLEIHGNLGGQEPGAKKQFEYLLFEKMRLPTLKKLDFADNIVKFMEIYWKKCAFPTWESGRSGIGDEKTI